MIVEHCGPREHPCQKPDCDNPVEYLITWPDQATLYVCAECRKEYTEETPAPEAPAKAHKGKGKHKDEE